MSRTCKITLGINPLVRRPGPIRDHTWAVSAHTLLPLGYIPVPNKNLILRRWLEGGREGNEQLSADEDPDGLRKTLVSDSVN